MEGATALVFGSRGFLGSKLSKSLAEQYSVVWLLDRSSGSQMILNEIHNQESKRTHAISCWEHLENIMENIVPDVAFNCVAATQKDDSYGSIDKLVVANLAVHSKALKLCAHFSVKKIVAFSTFSSSFDGVTFSPQSFYSATKEASLSLSKWFSDRYEIPIAHLELTDLYGSGQPHPRLIPSLAGAILRGEDFSMTKGAQEISPLHVEDAVDAAIFASSLNFQGVSSWAVRGHEEVQVNLIPDLIRELLEEVIGRKSSSRVTFDKEYRYREIMDVASRYPELPGWKAKTTLNDGLRMLIQDLLEG